MKMSCFRFCVVLAVALLSSLPFLARAEEASDFDGSDPDEISVSADAMHFDEHTRMMLASENVHIEGKGVTVDAQEVRMDVDNNQMIGSGNILINRDQTSLKARTFLYDLDNEIVTVNEVNTAIRPAETRATGNLFVKADMVVDKKGVKTGYKGFITSCDRNPPDYFIQSNSFDYYPDQRVIGHDVVIWSPLWLIPFGVWTPYYSFELGKRNPILLAPQIGQNPEDGWFVQSTTDWWLNPGASANIFVDYFEKKGYGGGVKYKYNLDNQFSGFAYGYALPDPSGYLNNKWQWDNYTRWSEDTMLVNSFSKKARYRSGTVTDESNLRLEWQLRHLGDNQTLTYTNSSQSMGTPAKMGTPYNQFSVVYDKQFNDMKDLNVNYTHIESQAQQDRAAAVSAMRLPWDILSNTQVNYERRFNTLTQKVVYEKAQPVITLSQPLPGLGSHRLAFDYTIDVSDLRTLESFMDRIPEYTLDLAPLSWSGKVASMTISVNWKETFMASYLAEFKPVIINSAPQYDEFDAAKYLFRQNPGLSVSDLPMGLQLAGNWNWDQYVYSTNDQMYAINQSWTLDAPTWPFVNVNTTFIDNYGYGNSPFYRESGRASRDKSLTYAVRLFWPQRDQLYMQLNSGWDYIQQLRRDVGIEAGFNPNNLLRITLGTVYIYPENRQTPETRFGELGINVDTKLMDVKQAAISNPATLAGLGFLLPGLLFTGPFPMSDLLAVPGISTRNQEVVWQSLIKQKVITPSGNIIDMHPDKLADNVQLEGDLNRLEPGVVAQLKKRLIQPVQDRQTLRDMLSFLPDLNISTGYRKDVNTGDMRVWDTTIALKAEHDWDARGTFRYDLYEKVVRLTNLMVIKDLHCRQVTVTYTYPKEFMVTYSINLFPDDKISITKDRFDQIKFQGGYLNDQRSERF